MNIFVIAPMEYNITKYLKNDQLFKTLILEPLILYEIVVLAREDLGPVFGHTYVHSRVVQFKTSPPRKKIRMQKKQKKNIKAVAEVQKFPYNIPLFCLFIILIEQF